MDRKAIIRKYRDTPRTMGVFLVKNSTTGKALLGVSRDLPAGLNRQRAQLRMGGHPNGRLQADWNALGADAFTFEVVDTMTPRDDADYDPEKDLNELEALWREKLGASLEDEY